jgi:glycopeptide antibiotics resistance protein
VTRRILAIALAVYLLFVGWVTLNPAPPDPAGNGFVLWLLRVLPISYDALEFTANVGMFVPIGVLVAMLSRHWWIALVVGVALTCGIEFTQQFLPARFPSVSDLVANSSGALVGALAVSCASRFRRREPETSPSRPR